MSVARHLPDLARLVAHLAAERAVLAPVAGGESFTFCELEPDATPELCREPTRLAFSAKALLFAEREPLFRFDGRRFLETLPQTPPRVLFGLTACDLSAIAYMDRFFAEDAHYRARRAATLLVGVDCERACSSGFCTTVDSGPSVRDGTADLILVPASEPDGSFTLIAASEPGAAAIAGLELPEAPGDWPERRSAQTRAAEASFPDRPYLERGIAKLNGGAIDADTWEELGLRCIACTGCTSVCPTCSCFAPRDEPDGDDGHRRVRYWDSCQLEGFQREASGHHPAPTPGARLERFFRHKLGDGFEAAAGGYSCVGCGRCEAVCPGVLGMHSTLTRLAER